MKSDRVEKLKRKYGANCFVNWGKKGGSPIIKRWVEQHAKRHHKG